MHSIVELCNLNVQSSVYNIHPFEIKCTVPRLPGYHMTSYMHVYMQRVNNKQHAYMHVYMQRVNK